SVFIVPIKVNSTHKNSVNHTINTVIPRVNSPISFEGFKVELNFLLQHIKCIDDVCYVDIKLKRKKCSCDIWG
ncbi:MAG: hypothetical protein MR863_06620, partial [Solobacterium sp.]|nr:hypothetical protein [Solobacterium sp.]